MVMKKTNIKYFLPMFMTGLLLASCSLNRDPLDSYTDVSQGKTENGTQIVFKNRSEVDNFLSGIYQQMRDRQEHWYLDLLLIGDSHADNAYAGTTGAEVVPFEIILLRDPTPLLIAIGHVILKILRGPTV
jgi:hypothetical protein